MIGVDIRATDPFYMTGVDVRATNPLYMTGVDVWATAPFYMTGVDVRATTLFIWLYDRGRCPSNRPFLYDRGRRTSNGPFLYVGMPPEGASHRTQRIKCNLGWHKNRFYIPRDCPWASDQMTKVQQGFEEQWWTRNATIHKTNRPANNWMQPFKLQPKKHTCAHNASPRNIKTHMHNRSPTNATTQFTPQRITFKSAEISWIISLKFLQHAKSVPQNNIPILVFICKAFKFAKPQCIIIFMCQCVDDLRCFLLVRW